MSFDQSEYIKKYNKDKYKMYQFRVKTDNLVILDYLDNVKNRNEYINSLLENSITPKVYTLKQLRNIIVPILHKHGIYDIYLFGSYARGEAGKDSDIDIYCSRGNIRTMFDQASLEEELEQDTGKKADIIFEGAEMGDYFKNQIMEDLIKLC